MAFSRFAKEHKDAWMYVHSQAKQDPVGGGIDLDKLANIVGGAHPAGSGSRTTPAGTSAWTSSTWPSSTRPSTSS